MQSKDEEKLSQKSATESNNVVDDSQMSVDQDELSCGAGGLEVSTSRSGSTSERRVTRASARSQQQRGRSGTDGMIHLRFVSVVILPCIFNFSFTFSCKWPMLRPLRICSLTHSFTHFVYVLFIICLQ